MHIPKPSAQPLEPSASLEVATQHITATQQLINIYGENKDGERIIKMGKFHFLTSAVMQHDSLQIRIHCLDEASIKVSMFGAPVTPFY